MNRLFRVLGSHSVCDVEPGGVSDFEDEPGLDVAALVAGGHLEEVADEPGGAEPVPEVQQEAQPVMVVADDTGRSADQ